MVGEQSPTSNTMSYWIVEYHDCGDWCKWPGIYKTLDDAEREADICWNSYHKPTRITFVVKEGQ